MSKMFDYISGKKNGKIAKLEAELEHIMAHCVPASALDEQRNAVIEECARVVSDRADFHTDRDLRDVLGAVAAAIRALKDKRNAD